MGDRANCIVKQSNGDEVWLYTHWGGCELQETVQAAMRRNQRWFDPAYLTRIIFCEMVKGQEAEETGFGISTSMSDNEHNLVVVDPKEQEVRIETEGRVLLGKWSFPDFCASDLKEAWNT